MTARNGFVMIGILLSFVAGGCLLRVTSANAPTDAAVGGEFVIAVDGIVSGDGGGVAGIVAQIPESFDVISARYVSAQARRSLRRRRSIENRYRAEEGMQVYALIDSVGFPPGSEEFVRVFLTLRPNEPGQFAVKWIAGAFTAEESSKTWVSTDPKSTVSFETVDDPRHRALINVGEAERNGTAALLFSGANEYLALPDSGLYTFAMDQDFTFETWLSTTAIGTIILSTRGDDFLSPFPFEIGIDEYGSLRAVSCGGDSLVRTASMTFIADGRWHHVAVTYRASDRRLELYQDGFFLEQLSIPPDAVRRPGTAVHIGARAARTMNFTGILEDIRFWSVTRSQEEIQFYRTIALTGFEKNLYSYYTFDKTQGGEILNSAENDAGALIAFNRPKLMPSTVPIKIELLSFVVSIDGNEVHMTWETFDESKVKRYDVEKRSESGKYTVLFVVEPRNSAGNHQVYHYTDTWSERSVAYYRLRRINTNGSILLSDEIPVGSDVLLNFTLGDSDPNPFGSITEVPYTLSEATHVTLRIYDLMGRVVSTLVDNRQTAGSYRAEFNGSDLSPGLYFCKIQTSSGAQTKKMYLMH